jgi:hypothetical protein
MKTFEEWFKDRIGTEERSAFEGWQACAAEYQRELNMMETRAIDAENARDVEHRNWEAVDREGYTLRAIIDEARKLAEKWVTGMPPLDTAAAYCRCADDLRAVLDRSGARGGSGDGSQ